nr:serine/threonine-protein kinase bri1-like 1 [Quercus suber]
MANNQLEGPVLVELCKLVNLKYFDLSKNNLSGLVPSCFNSSSIQFFHLDENSLSGPIPSVFPNNSNLIALNLRDNYLSGNIPNWIGSVSSLSIPLLGENHLEGRIPIQLCLLQNLNLLDLSSNKISGPIPHCLSNLTFASAGEYNSRGLFYVDFTYPNSPTWAYLLEAPEIDAWAHVGLIEEVEFTTKSRTYSYMGDILNYLFGIDLSSNMLVGEIPPQLGRISSNIRAINLSHNYLNGSIPITFSNLKQMESLDLSYNNLNGKIPPQLTELTSLEVFSVAHNNLSGPLPDRKNQFGTFDENSYEGNPLLCGPPLHKDCTKIGPQSIMPVDHMEEKSGSFMDISVFYISFVVAYMIVLLGIVTVLYINPYWRKAWFNLIEECIDTCYCFVVVYYHKLFNFRLA